MAQRIEKPKGVKAGRGAAASANTSSVSDMEVLHPERELQLAGEAVVVREYGNVEWLRLLPRAEPLVATIAQALQADESPTYEQALRTIAEHVDGLLPLIAQAVDREPAWVDTLAPAEVEMLLMTWWGVNAHFFVQRAINRVAVAMRASEAREAALAGVPFTQPSSPTATDSATLGSTPSGS
ncbi:hypothetical protein GY14_30165 [Delftia tsuruhatensis]|nr:hypothetical protein GY14_30165 [Delftia tsuruhatensis]